MEQVLIYSATIVLLYIAMRLILDSYLRKQIKKGHSGMTCYYRTKQGVLKGQVVKYTEAENTVVVMDYHSGTLRVLGIEKIRALLF